LKISLHPAENGDHLHSTYSMPSTQPSPAETTLMPLRTLVTKMPTPLPSLPHEEKHLTVSAVTLATRDTQLATPITLPATQDTLLATLATRLVRLVLLPVPPVLVALQASMLDTTLLNKTCIKVRLGTLVLPLVRILVKKSEELCKGVILFL
jgi:hypothetical protein